jgi:hypothetical protein
MKEASAVAPAGCDPLTVVPSAVGVPFEVVGASGWRSD